MKFKTGDVIVISCGDRTVDGVIDLASSNNVSLMLSFEALLAGHAGQMPVLLHDDGVYRSIINGAVVEVRKRKPVRARA